MQTGSLVNHIASRSTNGQPDPEVGMGVTLLHWTDRSPATVVEVSENGKTIKVQEDNATREDSNGMSESQQYKYEANTDAPIHTYTLRKNGRWVRRGEPMKEGGTLRIGSREKYHDYSF